MNKYKSILLYLLIIPFTKGDYQFIKVEVLELPVKIIQISKKEFPKIFLFDKRFKLNAIDDFNTSNNFSDLRDNLTKIFYNARALYRANNLHKSAISEIIKEFNKLTFVGIPILESLMCCEGVFKKLSPVMVPLINNEDFPWLNHYLTSNIKAQWNNIKHYNQIPLGLSRVSFNILNMYKPDNKFYNYSPPDINVLPEIVSEIKTLMTFVNTSTEINDKCLDLLEEIIKIRST